MSDQRPLTTPATDTAPAEPGRRRLFKQFGVAAGAMATGLSACPMSALATTTTATPQTTTEQQIPWLGQHQAGILTPRPRAGMVASFYVLATDRADLTRLFKTLTARIAFLTQGGLVPEIDPKFPPPDSGLLGPVIKPDALTITLSVGATLFDERFGLTAAKPVQLNKMQRHPNDALNAELCHGDLSIQFCANTPDTIIHALRDIIKHTPDLLVLHWKQEGNVPPEPVVPGQKPGNARNFLGFHDGSANPSPEDTTLMNNLVWVQPGHGEPAWATGGSYQAVRLIRNFVERWDRTPLQEQEAIMGRKRNTGAPLDGGTTEHDVPDYSKDPDGKLTPLDSHIRLANPRTAATEQNLILRRPFNYSNGVTRSGQLDMGLLFICYQSDLQKGFITVQKRLDGEPLEEYIKPVGGGFFYTLPGIVSTQDWFGRTLMEATA
jgi:deferrochelatase/peroxidase EfeB